MTEIQPFFGCFRESADGVSRQPYYLHAHHFRVENPSVCQGFPFPALRVMAC